MKTLESKRPGWFQSYGEMGRFMLTLCGVLALTVAAILGLAELLFFIVGQIAR